VVACFDGGDMRGRCYWGKSIAASA
jgi:hypothetical protein